MPRVLWKGAISFGLVNIPVGLYSAVKTNDLDFTMLDRRNLSPVGYKRVNKETGREVPWDEIVKGYEYRKGSYVVMSDEDFKRANVDATQTVDIVAFVEAGDIPLLYFDTPYYLAPDKRGEKGYALLRETLRKSGKVGIANVVVRTKQHLAVLWPMEDMLVLGTLRYHDEIRPADEFNLPKSSGKGKSGGARVSVKEVEMALKLVEGMSGAWDPEKFHDTYKEDILKRVKEKVKAGETELITEPGKEKPEKKGAKVIDLMELLKKSVEGGEKPARQRRAPRKAARAPAERRRHA